MPPRSTQRLVVLVGYGLGTFALYSGLPSEIPPAWTMPGGGVLGLGGLMVAFLLPTALLVTDVLLRGLCVNHPIDAASVRSIIAIYDAVMLRFSLFVVGVHGTVLLAMFGLLFGQEWAARIVPLMLGLMMISVGNLLPKTRPNLAIGIRTQRTLSDRALWVRLHRAAGYIVVASGAVIVLSALAVPRPVGPGMILLVGPAALVGTLLIARFSGRRSHA